MSRKKHNISYIKPEEPAFLRRLKEEAGFVEGPTVDTKVIFYNYLKGMIIMMRGN